MSFAHLAIAIDWTYKMISLGLGGLLLLVVSPPNPTFHGCGWGLGKSKYISNVKNRVGVSNTC